MRTQAFYSTEPGADPVFHDSTRCEIGKAVELKYMRSGSNGYKQCPRCAMYNWM